MSGLHKPAVPAACACGRLRRASRALTQLYDDVMAPSGLRVTQFSLLRTLAREGPCGSPRSRQRRCSTAPRCRAISIRWLRAASSRSFPGRDARTREVALTRAGTAALRAAEPHWKRAQARVAKRLGAGTLDALIATLAELESLHPAPARRARVTADTEAPHVRTLPAPTGALRPSSSSRAV